MYETIQIKAEIISMEPIHINIKIYIYIFMFSSLGLGINSPHIHIYIHNVIGACLQISV